MSVRRPTPEQLREVAWDLGMSFDDAELELLHDQFAATMAAYDLVDQLPDYIPEVKYPRSTGYRPGPSETRSTPGIGRPASRAPPTARSRARRSRSRTMSASPACR